MSWSRRRDASSIFSTAILVVLSVFTLYPLLFMVFTSFKDNGQFYHSFLEPAWPLHLENYASALAAVGPYVVRSILITGGTTIGVLVVASLAAYAFARHSFPGRELLFGAVILVVMVPFVLTLIPQFILVRDLGLLDSYLAYYLPYIASAQVLAIFILRNFFAGLPNELFEAARIDGAGELQTLRHVVLPLSQPALVTVAIITMVETWNDLVWPTVIGVQDEMRTITVGLASYTDATRGQYGPLFAGYTIASIPIVIVFLLTMRRFIAGMTSGAIKG